MSVAAYPWGALSRTSRESVRASRRVRGRLHATVTFERLEGALREVLGRDVLLVPRRIEAVNASPAEDALHFETADGALALALEMEAALAAEVTAPFVNRQPTLTDPHARLEPALRGALSAVIVEAARRSGARVPLRARSDAPSAMTGVRAEATLLLGERPYGVVAYASARGAPTRGETFEPDLSALGGLRIAVPLVVALSSGTREEVESLRVGDVWLPGEGFFHAAPANQNPFDSFPTGAVLAAPDGEYGVRVDRSSDGKLVLRGDRVALGADVAVPPAPGNSPMTDPDKTVHAIALDAPIVVRVEVASVTLSAREWAALAPGDVLETGTPLTSPVVLRVAGQEVARGELVDVDGELGVRIREVLDRG